MPETQGVAAPGWLLNGFPAKIYHQSTAPCPGTEPQEDDFLGMVTLTAGCRPQRTRLPERAPSSQEEPVEMGSLASKDTLLQRRPQQPRHIHSAESTSPPPPPQAVSLPASPLCVSRDAASVHFQEWEAA